jgi:hypothetical protein
MTIFSFDIFWLQRKEKKRKEKREKKFVSFIPWVFLAHTKRHFCKAHRNDQGAVTFRRIVLWLITFTQRSLLVLEMIFENEKHLSQFN